MNKEYIGLEIGVVIKSALLVIETFKQDALRFTFNNHVLRDLLI